MAPGCSTRERPQWWPSWIVCRGMRKREAPTAPATVYRARTLLVPDDLLQDDEFIAFINRILARRHEGGPAP